MELLIANYPLSLAKKSSANMKIKFKTSMNPDVPESVGRCTDKITNSKGSTPPCPEKSKAASTGSPKAKKKLSTGKSSAHLSNESFHDDTENKQDSRISWYGC